MRLARLATLLGGLAACAGDHGRRPDSEPDSSPTAGTTFEDPVAALQQAGPESCANPEARLSGPFERMPLPSDVEDYAWIYGGGVIAGDLDGDGGIDLVAPNQDQRADVYLSTAGELFAERDDVLAAFDLSYGTGGTAVDYDGDDDLDLYITRYDQPNVLLRNDGDLVFTDVTAAAGVSACDPGRCYKSLSSTWGDPDRDGDLDLVVGNYGFVPMDGTLANGLDPGDPSFFYRNDGDGTFTDATAEAFPRATMPQVHDGFTYIASFLDLDRDGWQELYFINDFGNAWPNVLLWNDAGTLVADDGRHGLDLNMTGMGLAVGDSNHDGLPDLVTSEWARLTLLESNAPLGIWLGVETAPLGLAPVAPQKVPWGLEYGDLDLDGREDLVVAYGYVRNDNTPQWSNPREQPDSVFLRTDVGFVDVAGPWGMDDAQVGRGFTLADLDRDGYLDVFKRDPMGPDVLYRSRCGDGSWLRIALSQPGTLNTAAVGAVVEVEVGGAVMRRWIAAGGRNFASAPPLEAHVGLGAAEAADVIRVFWPDGAVSEFHDVPARQRLRITRR